MTRPRCWPHSPRSSCAATRPPPSTPSRPTPTNSRARWAGTLFPVTQEAQPVNSSGNAVGCNANEADRQNRRQHPDHLDRQLADPRQDRAARSVADERHRAPPTGPAWRSTSPRTARRRPPPCRDHRLPRNTSRSKRAVAASAKEPPAAAAAWSSRRSRRRSPPSNRRKTGFVTTSGALKYPSKDSRSPRTSPPTTRDVRPGRRPDGRNSPTKAKPTLEGKGDQAPDIRHLRPPPRRALFELGAPPFNTNGRRRKYQALTGTYKATASTA